MGKSARMLCVDHDGPLWLEETTEGAWLGATARLICEGV